MGESAVEWGWSLIGHLLKWTLKKSLSPHPLERWNNDWPKLSNCIQKMHGWLCFRLWTTQMLRICLRTLLWVFCTYICLYRSVWNWWSRLDQLSSMNQLEKDGYCGSWATWNCSYGWYILEKIKEQNHEQYCASFNPSKVTSRFCMLHFLWWFKGCNVVCWSVTTDQAFNMQAKKV